MECIWKLVEACHIKCERIQFIQWCFSILANTNSRSIQHVYIYFFIASNFVEFDCHFHLTFLDMHAIFRWCAMCIKKEGVSNNRNVSLNGDRVIPLASMILLLHLSFRWYGGAYIVTRLHVIVIVSQSNRFICLVIAVSIHVM